MVAKNLGRWMPAWRVCIIAAALISLLSCAAMAGSVINAVNVINHPDSVVISVQADGPMRMGVISSSAGRYLGFQFPCRMIAKGKLVGIRSGRIYNVRCSSFSPNPPATRIVVNTAAHVNYSTEWSADKKRVDITVVKFGGAQLQPAQQSQCTETTAIVDKNFVPIAAPVQGNPVTASAKLEAKMRQAAPASLAIPSPAAPAECLPAIIKSQQASPVKSSPVPAEPVAILASPAVTVPPAFSEPVKTIITPARSVQVAVAPAIEHIAKGSDSGIEGSPATRTLSLAPNVVERPRPAGAKIVSLNFLGADIHDVLKALSTQSGTNIVAGKDVSGNITVSLNNVGIEEALDYVAKLSGYNYTKENETYLVGSRGSIDAITNGTTVGPKVTVAPVKYCNVKNMIEVLKNQFPDMKFANGNGSDDKDNKTIGGVIVISGATDTVDSVKSVIEQIDESMRGITQDGDSDVYYVKYVSISELANTLESLYPGVRMVPAPSDGFDLSAPDSTTGGAPSAANTASAGASGSNGSSSGDTKFFSTRSPGLIIYGTKAVIQKVMETAAKLDVKPPMIKIEAKVTSLNETGEKKLGLTWTWGDFSKMEVSPNHWERQPIDFMGTLDALIKNGDGKLLAAPNLMCIEGKPGSFFVGDKVRYILYVEQTDNGKNIKTEEANVGIELRVAGDVSPEGYITMNLHPEVSVLQLNKDEATGITLPIISRRYTDHVIRVKNGETIVIGGLISDNDLINMQKIPLLGDIPLFGHLFRHKSTTTEHTEVVIFITASIVKD